MSNIKQLIINCEENKNNHKIVLKLITDVYYYFRKHGIDSEFISWIMARADDGSSIGELILGIMYYYAHGVPKDYQRAIEWYQKSADQGDADGQNNLGIMYQLGYGVVKDYQKAVECYQKSAEQGNASAEYNLGVMYENGYGVAKNIGEALMYYKLSMEQGHEQAQKNIINLVTNNPEIILLKLSELEKESKEMKTEIMEMQEELEELRITAPIQGGPEYQSALKRFNEYKENEIIKR
jgi:TPR repeat protein